MRGGVGDAPLIVAQEKYTREREAMRNYEESQRGDDGNNKEQPVLSTSPTFKSLLSRHPRGPLINSSHSVFPCL